jgi:IS30 family transposase
VEDRFQDILMSVEEKRPRSRLEPYGELIDELRRREFTYRQIAGILTEKFQVRVPKSTLHDFVRARMRKRPNAPRSPLRQITIQPAALSESAIPHAAREPSKDEIRQRIVVLKARKPTKTRDVNDFRFDATEPLRIVGSGKQDPND